MHPGVTNVLKNLVATLPNTPQSYRYYSCYDHPHFKGAKECQFIGEFTEPIDNPLEVPSNYPRLLDPIYLSKLLGTKVAIRKSEGEWNIKK